MKIENSNFKKEFTKRLVYFSVSIVKFCNELKDDKFFRVIIDQLIRSATSIGANVIEAKSSSSKLEYIRYFQIALKSANETKYWLVIIKETNIKFKNKCDELLKEVGEIANILGAGILTMKGKNKVI